MFFHCQGLIVPVHQNCVDIVYEFVGLFIVCISIDLHVHLFYSGLSGGVFGSVRMDAILCHDARR